MKTISAKRLEAAGACKDQVRLFRDTFGDKPVRLTPENWDKAGEVGLTRFWLERFLKKAAQTEFIRAYETDRAEFYWVRDAARAEFYRVCGAARAEFDRVCGAARAEFDRVCDAAQAEYNRVRGAALLEALTK